MRHDSNEIFTIQIKAADPDIREILQAFPQNGRVRDEPCSEELKDFLKTAFLRGVRVTHAPNNSFVIPRLDGGAGRRCSSSTYSGIQRIRMRSPHRSLGDPACSRILPTMSRSGNNTETPAWKCVRHEFKAHPLLDFARGFSYSTCARIADERKSRRRREHTHPHGNFYHVNTAARGLNRAVSPRFR